MSDRNMPRHLKPRREKLFGDGRPRALDRNAKVRVMTRARALMRRTEKGKHYGAISAKAYAVLEALLWGFHNARSGLCFPKYESIAAKAGCARSTVAEAIKALEAAGLLTWVNRIVRIREAGADLFGVWANRWRIMRTSNGYQFLDPNPGASAPALLGNGSKSDLLSGTPIQDSISTVKTYRLEEMDPDLLISLGKFGKAVREKEQSERAKART
jgi:hypothetical protein